MNTGRIDPASVSFPTREAQTFPSTPSNHADQTGAILVPAAKELSEATGIGNSIIIIDAGAQPREQDFRG
jgi:hypothetical protein